MNQRVTFASTSEVSGNTISGVAHAFGHLAAVGNVYFKFDRKAFDAALATSDIRAFLNHDTTLLLGRQKAGTVRVNTANDGLHFEIDLPDTSYANDMKVLLSRGDMTEMSFGILPGKFTTSRHTDGKQIITHTSVKDIFDISPVSMPAFEGTSIALHSRSFAGETVRSQAIKIRHRILIPQEH